MNVLGVAGSMRVGSHSTHMLEIILKHAEENGAQVRLLSLRTVDMPMYRPRHASDSPAVAETKKAVDWADAFILASPDYHGSMSGALKNFLDYYWRSSPESFSAMCAHRMRKE